MLSRYLSSVVEILVDACVLSRYLEYEYPLSDACVLSRYLSSVVEILSILSRCLCVVSLSQLSSRDLEYPLSMLVCCLVISAQ